MVDRLKRAKALVTQCKADLAAVDRVKYPYQYHFCLGRLQEARRWLRIVKRIRQHATAQAAQHIADLEA